MAAGEGSRLAPYTDIIPKIMFPVGRKPLGRYIVESLTIHGFNDIILCVNEEWYPIIEDYFGDGEKFKSKINYSISKKPLGTAEEVRQAMMGKSEDFLLYYGDIVTDINLAELRNGFFNDFYDKNYMGTLVVQDKINTEVGLISIENGRIEWIAEKAQLSFNSWGAIAILKRGILNYVTPNNNDFAAHIFPKVIKDGFKLKAYMNTASWYDVGNISSYQKVRKLYGSI